MDHLINASISKQNKQYKEPTRTGTVGRQLLRYLLSEAAIIETSPCKRSQPLWTSLPAAYLNLQCQSGIQLNAPVLKVQFKHQAFFIDFPWSLWKCDVIKLEWKVSRKSLIFRWHVLPRVEVSLSAQPGSRVRLQPSITRSEPLCALRSCPTWQIEALNFNHKYVRCSQNANVPHYRIVGVYPFLWTTYWSNQKINPDDCFRWLFFCNCCKNFWLFPQILIHVNTFAVLPL